jgi:hypothetical protein
VNVRVSSEKSLDLLSDVMIVITRVVTVEVVTSVVAVMVRSDAEIADGN